MADQLGAMISLDLYRRKRKASSWAPDPVVAYWPCRIPGCREKIGVTETAIEVLEICNAEIVRRSRRGESLIESDEVMLCADHAPVLDRRTTR
jgi:hypothetical protein